jgi:hypothetical protein
MLDSFYRCKVRTAPLQQLPVAIYRSVGTVTIPDPHSMTVPVVAAVMRASATPGVAMVIVAAIDTSRFFSSQFSKQRAILGFLCSCLHC